MSLWFTDFLASPVMREALVPAILIAVVTASASVMVVAHRLSFLTVGVSHASLAGFGLALLAGFPLLPGATAFAVVISMLLAAMPHRRGLGEDAGTGMLFAGSMALGVVLLSGAPRASIDLFGLLFGDILTVSESELRWLTGFAIAILLALLAGGRAWWLMAFDPVAASAAGLPVGPLRLLLHALIGITVMLCVKMAGIVLTAGLLVLPAACAWFWGRSLAGLWAGSLAFSLAGTLSGLFMAWRHDWPAGACLVLALCVLFALSWGASWLRTTAAARR
ncbi:MAG: metal ABC transporter permease [Mariprofundaceae bacterium]